MRYEWIIGLLFITVPPVTYAEHIITGVTINGWTYNYFAGTYTTTVTVTSTRVSGPSDNSSVPGGIRYGLWTYSPNTNTGFSWTMPTASTAGSTHTPIGINSGAIAATWKTLEDSWFTSNSSTVQWNITSQNGEGVCIMPGYVADTTTNPLSQNNPPATYPGGSYCYPVPGLSTVNCSISPADITLDFGTINTGSGNVNRNATLTVLCDGTSTVTFADASGRGGQKDLAGGIVTLRINGGLLPQTVSAVTGSTPVTLSGNLSGTFTTPGVYSDVIPIAVTYQ